MLILINKALYLTANLQVRVGVLYFECTNGALYSVPMSIHNYRQVQQCNMKYFI